MTYQPGDIVLLKHTREIGKICRVLEPLLFLVELDGDEIPVYEEDIEPYQELQNEKTYASNATAPQSPAAATEWTKPGLYTAFLPDTDVLDIIRGYRLVILNGFNYSLDVKGTLSVQGEPAHQDVFQVPFFSFKEWGYMALAQINQQPKLYYNIRYQPFKKEETVDFQLSFQPKAKKFGKPKENIEALQEEGWIFLLKSHLPQRNSQPYSDELADFKVKGFKTKPHRIESTVGQIAHFKDEVDLHIEKLTENASSLTNAEILHLQLNACEQFLHQALKMGLHTAFIIHGVGKGKLKEEVSAMLRTNPFISRFSHAWHPKYGMGATQVWF